MRRSTVQSLPHQLVFPGGRLERVRERERIKELKSVSWGGGGAERE